MNRNQRKENRKQRTKNLSSVFCFLFSVFCLLLISTSFAAEDGVSAKAYVDKTAIYIGDKIRYTISVSSKEGIEIEFPKPEGGIAQFAVRETGVSKYSQWAILTIYKTGKQSIAGQEVKVKPKGARQWTSLKTNAVDIEVKSLLAENPKATDIRDIKGVLQVSRNPLLTIILIILAAALIAPGAYFLAKKYLFEGQERLPPKTADELAYEELERIKMSALLYEGRVKEYYFRLSTCVRHYIENRFSIRAPEMTLEEFLAAVGDSRNLSEPQKDLLKDFLGSCDMVKFAKYSASRKEAEASFDFAKRFVDETKEEK